MSFRFSQIFPLALGGAFALGLGFGLGLTSSDKTFVLEVSNTPLGSFVLKGNFRSIKTFLHPTLEEEKGQAWLDDLA